MEKTIAMDVDDVCANLMEEWLRRYNNDYKDNLKPEDIKSWAIGYYVSPKCGNAIYLYLEDKSLYDSIKPVSGALEGIQALRKMGFRVVFTTSTSLSMAGTKFEWLKKHGFAPVEKDYIEIRDKSFLNMSYMLDDRYDNVYNFSHKGVLFTAPWNALITWKLRVNNWNEVVSYFNLENKFLWS